jgi:hypothetical protein
MLPANWLPFWCSLTPFLRPESCPMRREPRSRVSLALRNLKRALALSRSQMVKVELSRETDFVGTKHTLPQQRTHLPMNLLGVHSHL